MSIYIDDVSEPGAWQRAIDRGCLGELRTHGADSAVDDELPEQFPRDREPYRLVGEMKRVPVHIHSDSEMGARHHAR